MTQRVPRPHDDAPQVVAQNHALRRPMVSFNSSGQQGSSVPLTGRLLGSMFAGTASGPPSLLLTSFLRHLSCLSPRQYRMMNLETAFAYLLSQPYWLKNVHECTFGHSFPALDAPPEAHTVDDANHRYRGDKWGPNRRTATGKY